MYQPCAEQWRPYSENQLRYNILNFSLECDSNQKAPITSTIIHL